MYENCTGCGDFKPKSELCECSSPSMPELIEHLKLTNKAQDELLVGYRARIDALESESVYTEETIRRLQCDIHYLKQRKPPTNRVKIKRVDDQ